MYHWHFSIVILPNFWIFPFSLVIKCWRFFCLTYNCVLAWFSWINLPNISAYILQTHFSVLSYENKIFDYLYKRKMYVIFFLVNTLQIWYKWIKTILNEHWHFWKRQSIRKEKTIKVQQFGRNIKNGKISRKKGRQFIKLLFWISHTFCSLANDIFKKENFINNFKIFRNLAK